MNFASLTAPAQPTKKAPPPHAPPPRKVPPSSGLRPKPFPPDQLAYKAEPGAQQKANSQVQRILERSKARKQARPLPQIQDARSLLTADLPRPPELVHGILHRGTKMVIGGGSKSFKTWSLLDLAVSVAAGVPWWGFDTEQGRVLYMNFEIQDVFFAERLQSIVQAKKNCVLKPRQLLHWGLRGHAADLEEIMPQLITDLNAELNPERKEPDLALIIFDPIYKGLGDRDENKAGDIAHLLNEIEALAVQTGAAVAFGHHFSKGNQAGKDAIDRIGGSGVFTRDPDTILTMTRHEQEDAFTVDAILRNLPPIESFAVRREHPLMVRDDALNPAELKKPGATQVYSDDDILAPLKDGKALAKQAWFRAAHDAIGISQNGFKNRVSTLEAKGVVAQVGEGKRTDPWALAP